MKNVPYQLMSGHNRMLKLIMIKIKRILCQLTVDHGQVKSNPAWRIMQQQEQITATTQIILKNTNPKTMWISKKMKLKFKIKKKNGINKK